MPYIERRRALKEEELENVGALSDAAVVGICVAVFFCTMAILGLAICILRVKKRRHNPRHNDIELGTLGGVGRPVIPSTLTAGRGTWPRDLTEEPQGDSVRERHAAGMPVFERERDPLEEEAVTPWPSPSAFRPVRLRGL